MGDQLPGVAALAVIIIKELAVLLMYMMWSL
jgi:hypothetical protein